MRGPKGTKVIDGEKGADPVLLEEAASIHRAAKKVVAFSGAGISVESGIPDFRSPGGLWTRFPPDEYATLDAFIHEPAKAWQVFRAIGETIAKAEPNPAHKALARLEEAGKLAGVITQNIDGLHQGAGSREVIEVHGDHQRLQCIDCGALTPLPEDLLEGDIVPVCSRCERPLKPNVVLFGEAVRGLEEIARMLSGCDLLLVVG
ncbi:MAG: SIR2 family NAD-dependent protein deacylase, partial [Planctomycetota bacterium]